MRDSNIELLRLLAMNGIVLMHFLGLSVYPAIWTPAAPLTLEVVLGTLVCSMTILSVNCFGLISGYFGIRFSWKGLAKLYLCCSFYGLLGALIGMIYGDGCTMKDMILQTFLPFSHQGLWYISCYFGLYILSPLLNKAMGAMNRSEWPLILVLLCIFNVYMGRFWKVESFNSYGYCVEQLVFLYLIGGYLQRFVSHKSLPTIRIFVCLLVGIFVWTSLAFAQHVMSVPHFSPTSYNHVCVILSSICVFLLFLRKPFYNKATNWLATGTLAVYLFHMNTHVWPILNIRLREMMTGRVVPDFLFLFILSISTTLCCIFFDKVRSWLTMHALNKLFDK